MENVTDKQVAARGAIRWWLYFVSALVFAMVIVGGATRLTDSGLSITEWLPLLGAIPPLSEADWLAAFEKYKLIPEYNVVNKGMDLAQFQFIYWWEWSHRFLGRFIGVAFALPAMFFWFTGRLESALKPKVIVLFILGGLQGALGWYMVMSGLVERVDVSQYRLAAHLTFATIIYGAMLWVAYGIGQEKRHPFSVAFGFASVLFVGLVYLQIAAGGFVAGLDAGESYNTWPLMADALVPEGLWDMDPWWVNIFESIMTVQFDHRILAYVITLFVLVHAARQMSGDCKAGSSAMVLLIIVFAQVALGIFTLLWEVPILIALIHQGGALVLLTASIWHLHDVCICGR